MSMPDIVPVAPLSEYAIIVDQSDNLAVVKTPISHAVRVRLPDGRIVRVVGAVPSGHRFAVSAIPAGEFVLQFGQPIGKPPLA
jgi:hypothetical protein